MNISDKIKQNFAAFLASFSAQSPEHSALSTGNIEPQDSTLNTLFEALSTTNPDILTNGNDLTTLEKAEVLADFLTSATSKLQETSTKLAESLTAFDALQSELATRNQELETSNQERETLRQQLKAHPSIPLNVTDPALSFNNKPADTTGKDLLNSIPKDLKRKLSNSTKTTE